MNSRFVVLISLVFAMCMAAACNGNSKQVVAEAPPASFQASPESTPIRMPVAVAPKLLEVEDAVERVFKDAAVVHPDYKSSILTGDFNGDHSQDLAVVLKPEKLAEMNEEFPRWLLRDPSVRHNPRNQLRVEKNEVLLAVIHGYGANDWRDPEATQTFLLKNVVGSGMHVQNGTEFVKNNTGRKLPRPQGDLIGENLKGSEGYLYYNAATYSWYDPKTFKGDTEAPGAFHGRSAAMRRNN